jgi:hypothetical protein
LTFGEFDDIIAQVRQKPGVSLISRAAGAVGTVVTLPWDNHHGETADK